MKILYPIINGEVTGGNMICLCFMEEAKRRGWKVFVNSSTKGDFTEMIKDKCEEIYYFNTNKFYKINNAIKLSKVIKKEGIDLIHSHTPFAGTFLTRIAGKLSGIPVITHAHARDCLNPNPLVKRLEIFLNKVSSRLACNKIIAVSNAIKEAFVNQGHEESKIEVVHNGIDLKKSKSERNPEELREEPNIKYGQKVIGEVGRLCKQKGQHILIKAAPKVIKKFSDTCFVLVGEDLEQGGQYKKNLIAITKKIGVRNRFIFTGYRDDIEDLLDTFDLFVLPSSMEGLPVVILEAMAASAPVVATSVGGNSEVVIDGETGTIIPPENPEALAEAIIYHLENPEISKEMGQRGYERVKKHFSKDKMVKKTFQVYEGIIQSSG